MYKEKQQATSSSCHDVQARGKRKTMLPYGERRSDWVERQNDDLTFRFSVASICHLLLPSLLLYVSCYLFCTNLELKPFLLLSSFF